ncbi:hypothetical protein AK830_g4281 [Neonectria ditissima]|uniref:Uncharacterized protein n=1 Tax=Neonectria ditissima TaxID=78410 RepID=A0A0N8H7N7_9HYPO|nr:hypothetical protein AK830_g4281 [Neonectria ditissima]
MPWQAPPVIDFDDLPEYRWNFWKVGLKEDDLFGSLHHMFDEQVPLLDPLTFHHTVDNLASSTQDKDKFLCALENKKVEHLDIIGQMRYYIFTRVMEGHSAFDENQLHWFLHLHRFGSLNSLIFFLASLLHLVPIKEPPFLAKESPPTGTSQSPTPPNQTSLPDSHHLSSSSSVSDRGPVAQQEPRTKRGRQIEPSDQRREEPPSPRVGKKRTFEDDRQGQRKRQRGGSIPELKITNPGILVKTTEKKSRSSKSRGVGEAGLHNATNASKPTVPKTTHSLRRSARLSNEGTPMSSPSSEPQGAATNCQGEGVAEPAEKPNGVDGPCGARVGRDQGTSGLCQPTAHAAAARPGRRRRVLRSARQPQGIPTAAAGAAGAGSGVA